MENIEINSSRFGGCDSKLEFKVERKFSSNVSWLDLKDDIAKIAQKIKGVVVRKLSQLTYNKDGEKAFWISSDSNSVTIEDFRGGKEILNYITSCVGSKDISLADIRETFNSTFPKVKQEKED